METTKIYVDLDSLLDLRQAKLSYLLDVEKLADFIGSNDYNFRSTDKFEIVDMDEYGKVKYTKELLARSTVTYIINVIKQKIMLLEKRNKFANEVKSQELVVNTYPYMFSEEEKDVLTNAIFIKIGMPVFITLTYIKPVDISPSFMRNVDVAYAFIYNSTEWMNNHLASLEFTKLVNTVIYFPAISVVEPTEEQLKEMSKSGYNDMFTFMEFITSYHVKLQFLPIFFYTNAVVASAYSDVYIRNNKDTSINDLKAEEESNVSTT